MCPHDDYDYECSPDDYTRQDLERILAGEVEPPINTTKWDLGIAASMLEYPLAIILRGGGVMYGYIRVHPKSEIVWVEDYNDRKSVVTLSRDDIIGFQVAAFA